MKGNVKILVIALIAYFVAKYVVEPSPLGGIVASVLAPIGAMVSGLFPAQA